MRNIRYKIKFFTDWHCGSGLSSGADLDLLVIKDKNRLPFIPGKTIKGLVREAIEEIAGLRAEVINSTENIMCFGKESKGCSFFTNAVLEEGTQNAIIANKLQEYLYRSLASTAIDNEGIAMEGSLRKIEVCVPCELVGEILEVPDNYVEKMEEGLKFIKRLGQNRNRGLGKCQISILKGGDR